ncbi:hypothetical protein D3C76_1430360 [compost metagenome]
METNRSSFVKNSNLYFSCGSFSGSVYVHLINGSPWSESITDGFEAVPEGLVKVIEGAQFSFTWTCNPAIFDLSPI